MSKSQKKVAKKESQLVPITRQFLRDYYANTVVDPLVPEVAQVQDTMERCCQRLAVLPGCADIEAQFLINVPNKIDENLFRARQQLEHVTSLLSLEQVQKVCTNSQCASNFQEAFDALALFQKNNTERATNLVRRFMPQDFRASMLAYKHERGEKAAQAQIDKLMAAGGTIDDKYDLLWKQQMARREKLVMLGGATGVFKILVKLLAGVPQVLLNFIKTINDDQGPVEEVRIKFAPNLYALLRFCNRVHILLRLVAKSTEYQTLADSDCAEISHSITQAAQLLADESKRYTAVLNEHFTSAPWFVTASELAAAASPGNGSTHGQEVEVEVGAGSHFEVDLDCLAGDTILWEFVSEGYDIGFEVSFLPFETKTPNTPSASEEEPNWTADEPQKTTVVAASKAAPSTTVQGEFVVVNPGEYTLRWDNSYSYLRSKALKYNVNVKRASE